MKVGHSFIARFVGAGLLAHALSMGVRHASAGEYAVQRGDMIEISIAGQPDLRRRSLVGLGGELTVPLIGEVAVVGLTLQEIRKLVRQSFERHAYRARGAGNAEDVILASEVLVDIVEYGPIYVTGAVLAPGAHAFRPGITMRHAIALAGGPGRPGANSVSSQMTVAAITGQRAAMTFEADRQAAVLSRLEAELAELDGEMAQSLYRAASDSPAQETERKLKTERAADLKLETKALHRRIQQTSARLAQIEQQLKTEEKAQQLDELELQKLEGLAARGLVTAPRILETRRFLLVSATRTLQTSVQAESARREIADLQDRLERLPQQRRIQLLAEIQDTRGKLHALNSSLEATAEQLAISSVGGSGNGRTFLTLSRRSRPDSTIVPLPDDTMEPGDVLTVTYIVDGKHSY